LIDQLLCLTVDLIFSSLLLLFVPKEFGLKQHLFTKSVKFSLDVHFQTFNVEFCAENSEFSDNDSLMMAAFVQILLHSKTMRHQPTLLNLLEGPLLSNGGFYLPFW